MYVLKNIIEGFIKDYATHYIACDSSIHVPEFDEVQVPIWVCFTVKKNHGILVSIRLNLVLSNTRVSYRKQNILY